MTTGSVLSLLALIALLVVLKVLICGCLFHRRRRHRNEDRLPILEDAVERLYEIHQQRLRSRRAREPPPTFDDALQNSRPVSYIDIDEPPPTYEEYLKASTSPSSTNFNTGSINPVDTIVIPLELKSSGESTHESIA